MTKRSRDKRKSAWESSDSERNEDERPTATDTDKAERNKSNNRKGHQERRGQSILDGGGWRGLGKGPSGTQWQDSH